MVIVTIKTNSINNLELDIEDLYSKQTVSLLKYRKNSHYTKVYYDGLNQATIKACIKIYEPNMVEEIKDIINVSNESGMTLSLLRDELTKMITEL